MPFDISEEQLIETERVLKATLPNEYREAMKLQNGGELTVLGDGWQLYPIKDVSDRKRLSRTSNHIISETLLCEDYGNFPKCALAIAGNGSGDQIIFLIDSDGYSDSLYVWSHETGVAQEVATSFEKVRQG